MIFMVLLFVKSARASKKKSTVKEANTVCSARFSLSVPINRTAVKMPHMIRYATIAEFSGASARPILGITINATKDSQKKP